MKITKSQLKELIKEELGRVMGEAVDSIEELEDKIAGKIGELKGNGYPYQTYVDSALGDLNPNPTEEEELLATISGLEEAFEEGNYERYERD